MSLDETEFARFAAGSVFIAVPIVILYFFLVKKYGERHGAGSGKRLDTVYNQLLLNPFFHVKMGAGIAMTFP